MPQNPLPPPIVLKYVTRHKETTHEIYVLGAYFYERTSEGDYIRMKEVPEWLHDTVKENDIKTIIYHDEVFIENFKHRNISKFIVNNVIGQRIYKCYNFLRAETGVQKLSTSEPTFIGTYNDLHFFIDVNIAYNDLKIINYDTKEIVFEFPITEFENIFNG